MIAIAPESMISILAITLLGTGALLSRLPVGTCRECPHCRLAKLAAEREHALESGQAYAAAPFCAVCGRHHRVDEDHPI